jgi:glutamate dehydrogenase
VPEAAGAAIRAKAQSLLDREVPAGLAQRLASLDTVACATDIVLAGEASGHSIHDVAAIFFAADAAFGLSALLQAAAQLGVSDYYDRLALDGALGQIEAARRRLAMAIVAGASSSEPRGAATVERWIGTSGPSVEHIRKSVSEITAGGLTLSRATVAANLLSGLAPL